MRGLFQGTYGGLAAFGLITLLVVGGLGWVTRAALQLETEQREQQRQVEFDERLRLALWRLDSRIGAVLAREESRPFTHYSAVFAPPIALDHRGKPALPGSVLEPSPLLDAELPPWMLLHFQTDSRGWESPQVLSQAMHAWLGARPGPIQFGNVTAARRALLNQLRLEVPASRLLTEARMSVGESSIRDRVLLAQKGNEQQLSMNNSIEPRQQDNVRDFGSRSGLQSKLGYTLNNTMQRGYMEQKVSKEVALLNFFRNGEEWMDTWQILQDNNRGDRNNTYSYNGPSGNLQLFKLETVHAEVAISLTPMTGLWLPTTGEGRRLIVLRLVQLEKTEICQGFVLSEELLGDLLVEEVRDLFPEASIKPVENASTTHLGATMTTLPLRLEPGELRSADDPGWTPLRIGLSLAWAAALVALGAVGLVGWSLLDLSERRIRFVSAVTHELRTPLTTIRLYLEMLRGGFIQEEDQRRQYLETLEGESERLTRLVGNVLDFSRLENQNPRLQWAPIAVSELLHMVEAEWSGRCQSAGKVLVVEEASAGALLVTDASLLQQVLGTLLDNACKYSSGAADCHLWLRGQVRGGRVLLEVEDRGPGIPPGERGLIFRAFRRGRSADATTGGVGLGLALAGRWSRLLGGRLHLINPTAGGACFRVELPQTK
ncbi:MAG: histidine kinase dimerization/phospho-acceptor domain-containing protein [Gemmataceae bacterium]